MKFNRDTLRWRENISRAAWKVISAVQHVDDLFISNDGEETAFNRFLETMAQRQPGQPLTILDVGANVGAYSQMVLQGLKRHKLTGQLHIFEPGPGTFKRLQQNLGSFPECHLHNLAISDRAGELPFVESGGDGEQSFLATGRPGEKTIAVRVQRLDEFFNDQKIAHVDWLKFDVEGVELFALRGLGDWLHPDKISAIQFEYGGGFLRSGASLSACWELLEPRGYQLARLFSFGPLAIKYKPWLENFSHANYVALNPALLES